LSEKVSFQQVDLNVPLDFPAGYFDHIIGISVLQAVAHPNLHKETRPVAQSVIYGTVPPILSVKRHKIVQRFDSWFQHLVLIVSANQLARVESHKVIPGKVS